MSYGVGAKEAPENREKKEEIIEGENGSSPLLPKKKETYHSPVVKDGLGEYGGVNYIL